MGRLPASAAISLGLHALVGACLVGRLVACEPAAPRAEPGSAAAPRRPPADAPLEVELYAEPDAPAVLPPPAAAARMAQMAQMAQVARAAVAPSPAAVASPAPTPAATASPIVPTAPLAPHGTLLAMRDGADLRIHALGEPPPRAAPPPGPVVTGVDPAPTRPAAPLDAPTSPDAGALDPDETHEAFALEVAPDGTAHLHDGGNLRFFPNPPRKKDVQSALAHWHDLLERDSNGTPDVCANPTREDAPRPLEHPVHDIGVTIARFDINDWLLRRHGTDPYASAKLHQLDATREGRAEVGARYAHAALSHAGELAQTQMDTLWATVADPAERKHELFALWDECSETGSEDVVEATDHARARILKFIRARLPRAQPGAYTAAELAALNQQKQSADVFAPYESAE